MSERPADQGIDGHQQGELGQVLPQTQHGPGVRAAPRSARSPHAAVLSLSWAVMVRSVSVRPARSGRTGRPPGHGPGPCPGPSRR
ncbi:hypothetical protein ACFFX0_31500 [Citricoccus parietis]|uniref:Uncharacterized protein n=1 Tax=Citricoccus parietis TaxID=592307 RepID=A0ABV5G917_9MICC